LFDAESSIARNAAHRESVYWIVARNRHNANTIRHDDVFTLAQDAKAGLFQRLHGIEMIDAGNLCTLDRHPHFAHILTFHKIVDGGKVLPNSIPDVFERFGFGSALGPTAR
jgi:hypothetical protein